MRDGKHVVLCIDDDPDVLEALRLILEASGYICLRASTAADGLADFRREQPDLVLVDLMMEEVDAGANFAKELKAAGSDVPIFMLSSVGDSLSSMVDTGTLGLSGVLQKPPRPAELLALLKEQLG